MDDTISRQAAVSGISDLLMLKLKGERLPTYNEVYHAIHDLPSAQPGCEDAVSRKAAIDALPYLLDYEGFKGESGYVSKNLVRTMLKELPSVTPKQPGWIPCTPDTMPKMTDIYLVKVRINQYGEGMYPTFRTALWHTASRKWFVHESENSIIGEVTEWMPIPLEGGQE